MEPVFRRRKSKDRSLFETGWPAVGTVVAVRDTGATLDDDALRVVITFRVEPLDGSPPFSGERAATVARDALPVPGARYPVLYHPDDPQGFAYVTSDGGENARQRIVWIWGDVFGPDGSEVGQPPADHAAATRAAAPADPVDRLATLDALRRSGALTDEEFAQQKRRILGDAGTP
ncbi:MAG: SHOCT domain-containing protein [Actinomycetota bacterium]